MKQCGFFAVKRKLSFLSLIYFAAFLAFPVFAQKKQVVNVAAKFPVLSPSGGLSGVLLKDMTYDVENPFEQKVSVEMRLLQAQVIDLQFSLMNLKLPGEMIDQQIRHFFYSRIDEGFIPQQLQKLGVSLSVLLLPEGLSGPSQLALLARACAHNVLSYQNVRDISELIPLICNSDSDQLEASVLLYQAVYEHPLFQTFRSVLNFGKNKIKSELANLSFREQILVYAFFMGPYAVVGREGVSLKLNQVLAKYAHFLPKKVQGFIVQHVLPIWVGMQLFSITEKTSEAWMWAKGKALGEGSFLDHATSDSLVLAQSTGAFFDEWKQAVGFCSTESKTQSKEQGYGLCHPLFTMGFFSSSMPGDKAKLLKLIKNSASELAGDPIHLHVSLSARRLSRTTVKKNWQTLLKSSRTFQLLQGFYEGDLRIRLVQSNNRGIENLKNDYVAMPNTTAFLWDFSSLVSMVTQMMEQSGVFLAALNPGFEADLKLVLATAVARQIHDELRLKDYYSLLEKSMKEQGVFREFFPNGKDNFLMRFLNDRGAGHLKLSREPLKLLKGIQEESKLSGVASFSLPVSASDFIMTRPENLAKRYSGLADSRWVEKQGTYLKHANAFVLNRLDLNSKGALAANTTALIAATAFLILPVRVHIHSVRSLKLKSMFYLQKSGKAFKLFDFIWDKIFPGFVVGSGSIAVFHNAKYHNYLERLKKINASL